jgi:cytochrome P450
MTKALAAPESLVAEVNGLFAARPELVAERFRIYGRLRTEAPVLRLQDQVLVSRFADVAACLTNPKLMNGSGGMRSSFEVAALDRVAGGRRERLVFILNSRDRWMSQANGAYHATLRSLAHSSFTPASVQSLNERVVEVVAGLLDGVETESTIEVISSFAYQLPLVVVCELLDIPREDRVALHRWSVAIAAFQGGANLDSIEETYDAIVALSDYLAGVFSERRRSGSNDLLGRLLRAADDPSIEFTEEDLSAFVGQLVFAGHETTTNFIANAVYELLRNREQWDRLREEPGLLPNAIEELLRFCSPSQFAARTATEELQIDGVTIEPWETVRVMLGSANRDPDRYDEPDRLDIDREDVRHLSLGLGPHFCLGASLLRLESAIALKALLERYPEMRLTPEPVEWQPSVMFHGLRSLHVALGARRA